MQGPHCSVPWHSSYACKERDRLLKIYIYIERERNEAVAVGPDPEQCEAREHNAREAEPKPLDQLNGSTKATRLPDEERFLSAAGQVIPKHLSHRVPLPTEKCPRPPRAPPGYVWGGRLSHLPLPPPRRCDAQKRPPATSRWGGRPGDTGLYSSKPTATIFPLTQTKPLGGGRRIAPSRHPASHLRRRRH